MIPAVQYLTPSAGGGGKGSPSSPSLKKEKITGISVCFQQYFSTAPIHNGSYESKNALYIIIGWGIFHGTEQNGYRTQHVSYNNY